MTAPKVIKELVERFEANLSAYKSGLTDEEIGIVEGGK